MIHTINPIFRAFSNTYTKNHLILKTGFFLCDTYYKFLFQNLQQTLYKINLILKTGICLCDSYCKSPFQNLQQTLYKQSPDFENGELFI